jgi:hypothetical protein
MPYRLRYSINIDWLGAGMGPMGASLGVQQGAQGTSGPSQTLQLDNIAGAQNVAGGGAGGILNAGDITTLTNAMAADIAAQLTAQLTRLGLWATAGGG